MHQILTEIYPDDLVFDVGAHVGVKTQHFLFRGAKVVCIEPQPACVAHLKYRFKDQPAVAIEPFALGAAPGEAEMAICAHAPTISTLAEHWKHGRFYNFQWTDKTVVSITTLDAMIEKYGVPKYTKIDVEGFEREVLAGLSQYAGIISFEFSQEFRDHAEECVARLVSLGYSRFHVSLGESDRYLWDRALPASEFLIDFNAECDKDSDRWGDIYAF